jgi:hypothetical protein
MTRLSILKALALVALCAAAAAIYLFLVAVITGTIDLIW